MNATAYILNNPASKEKVTLFTNECDYTYDDITRGVYLCDLDDLE